MTYLIVFIGGGLGAGMRHGVNLLAARLLGTNFPYGTLAINVLGSAAAGLLAGWFAARYDPGQHWRLFLITGIAGGFTTFSAFSLEVALLTERGTPGLAFLYIVLTVVAGIGALFLALAAARYWL